MVADTRRDCAERLSVNIGVGKLQNGGRARPGFIKVARS